MPATFESHFPHKDKVIDPNKFSMVVFRLKFKNWPSHYIGQSKRIYKIRMKDHESNDKSHVFEHQLFHNLTGHEILRLLKCLNFRPCGYDKKTELKEIFYIRKIKPTLNKQLEYL
jgi:hypothetical protein